MSACLNMGILQAYLDSELRTEEMQSAAAHLTTCGACAGALDEMRSRAARVGAWLGVLADGPARPVIADYKSRSSAPLLAALALAASIVLFAVLVQRRPPASMLVVAHRTPSVQRTVTPTLAPVAATPARKRKARPRRRVDYFLPLEDGEPIQIGTVVEVNLTARSSSEQIRAELIVDDEGRARAIRFLE